MTLEDLLTTWAEGPSATEQEKCSNAENAVRRAIEASGPLKTLSVRVFTQGSYAARTNVKSDSDVDVCVCRYNQFFYQLPASGPTDPSAYGIYPVDVGFPQYKNLVGEALGAELGRDAVTRGNKAFDVHANTYRIDADVAPALEHRRYTGFDLFGNPVFESGIEIIADSGEILINWPKQTYDNGVAKNGRTKQMYKSMIRILKRLRNEMQTKNVAESQGIASFLIECLVWNTPDALLTQASYTSALRDVIAYTFNNTQTQATCNEWGEVNELMFLFRDGFKPWTRDQANRFVLAAWNYMGFK